MEGKTWESHTRGRRRGVMGEAGGVRGRKGTEGETEGEGGTRDVAGGPDEMG
jgi:hypothetical protein